MEPFLSERFGNASSLHSFGREGRSALERARRQVAELIAARPEDIVFTSGGTESDNFALLGVALRCQDRGKHLVASQIEHHAVLHSLRFLESMGFEVDLVPPGENGIVQAEGVLERLRPDTILVSLMTANNEIGTLQPISVLGAALRERGVVFHTDAVQAVGAVPINVQEMTVDLLSLSGHKLYGPKGIGALFLRPGTPMTSLIRGGDQERRRRGGTENVPGAVGLGRASELARSNLPENMSQTSRLRDRLLEGLCSCLEGVRLNGDRDSRLPNNVNVSFEGVAGESLLQNLDLAGLAVSNGSACSSGSPEPSHVLQALGLPEDLVSSAVRYTLGRQTSHDEVDVAIDITAKVVRRLRRMKQGTPTIPR